MLTAALTRTNMATKRLLHHTNDQANSDEKKKYSLQGNRNELELFYTSTLWVACGR